MDQIEYHAPMKKINSMRKGLALLLVSGACRISISRYYVNFEHKVNKILFLLAILMSISSTEYLICHNAVASGECVSAEKGTIQYTVVSVYTTL